ncbi:MAG: hypothetical protein AB8B99_15100 [Phormidesmis sp.]
MATPAFLRYLPARLKPLSSPAVWAPLTVFTLLSVFIWEYHKNPDWFNRPQLSNLDPDSELTPEEQARLSEIDTLDLLLRSTRTSESGDLSGDLLNIEGLDGADDATTSNDRNLAGRDNPFAAYEAEYQFPGSDGATATRTSLPEVSTPSIGTLGADAESSSLGSSALADALERQQAARLSGDNNSADGGSSIGSTLGAGIEGASSVSVSSSDLPTSEGSLNSGNNGGSIAFPSQSPDSSNISAPFIRTTTDMSPPVGTTGYQVPASANLPVFNVPSQQPTRSPFSRSVPTPAATAAPTPTPTVNYTAPSFTQPEQNRRR